MSAELLFVAFMLGALAALAVPAFFEWHKKRGAM